MLAQAERLAPEMSSFALATTLSALGRLKLQPSGLMDALLAAATSLAPSFDAKVRLLRMRTTVCQAEGLARLGTGHAGMRGVWSGSRVKPEPGKPLPNRGLLT